MGLIGSGTFFGMRDTDSFDMYDAIKNMWVTGKDNKAGRRPEDLNDMLLYLYPNNKAMLTALLSKMPKKPTTDPTFHWMTEAFPIRAGAVSGVYTDSAFSVVYTSGGVEGTVLYLAIPEATAMHLRPGHQVLLRSSLDYRVDVNAKVLQNEVNNGTGYCTVRLIEADDNAPTVVGPPAVTGHTLADCDWLQVNGNINPEGSGWPTSIVYNPTDWENFTQIFINPIEITRTAAQTTIYHSTDGGRADAKQKKLLEHGIDKELAFLFGVKSKTVGQNGHPERTTQGLIPTIKMAGHVSNYATDPEPVIAGLAWEEGWYLWLTSIMQRTMLYGESTERMCYVGPQAWMYITKALIQSNQNYFIWSPQTKAYGIKVVEILSPFGTFYLQSHPLMGLTPADSNSMIIFDPTDLRYRPLQDTVLVGSATIQELFRNSNNRGWTDSFIEGYLCEAGLEFHFPIKCAYLTGFGTTNLN